MGKKSQKRIVLYIYKYIQVFPIRRTFFDSSNSCVFFLFFFWLMSCSSLTWSPGIIVIIITCVCVKEEKSITVKWKRIYISQWWKSSLKKMNQRISVYFWNDFMFMIFFAVVCMKWKWSCKVCSEERLLGKGGGAGEKQRSKPISTPLSFLHCLLYSFLKDVDTEKLFLLFCTMALIV